MAGRLEGKVAIITGSGGKGLGRAGAVLFAKEGARVVVLDLTQEGVDATVRQITAKGGKAIGARTDVTKLPEIEAMVALALRTYGQIDILWNNAAVLGPRYTPAEQITLEDWNRVLSVNLTGYFLCVKCVVPHMKQRRKGAIINTTTISSLAAIRAGLAPYLVSKGGVNILTRQLALELGPFNIRVNSIAGGGGGIPHDDEPVPDTSPFNGLPFTGAETAMPLTEVTRDPVAAEFAQTALFLADDATGPLTGVIIAHDGGRTTR